jgi:uncharacterized membrane protein
MHLSSVKEELMYSKAKIGGHPIHPILVGFPVTFYTVTVIALIIWATTVEPFWFRVSLYGSLAGVLTAAVAAVPGLIDAILGIPRRTAARSTALLHGILNVVALALFFSCFGELWAQHRGTAALDATVPLVLSIAGFVITGVSGTLGWKLVQTHHVGVSPPTPEEIVEIETHTVSGPATHPR